MFSEKNYKKTFVVMTVLLFLVFLVTYFTILNRKKTSPVGQNIVSPTPYPILIKTEGSNYINWINNINPPVNGFSFMNKVLVYSNPNGFYEGYSNRLIQKEKILNIFWTAKGQALFNNGTTWKYYDLNKGTYSLKDVFISGEAPVLSPDGKRIIDTYANKLDLIEIDTNSSINKTFSSEVGNSFYSPDSTFFITTISSSEKQSVFFIDNKLNQIKTIDVGTDNKVLGVTPDQKIIVAKNNILSLIDSQNSLALYLLQTGSETFLYSINNNEYFLWEKVTDELKRKIDYIWRINTSGKKEFITSSKAVVKRFDQNITPFLSPDKNILLIAENKGVLWMISLLPNLFPSYTEKGFVFTQDISADKGI